MHEKSSERKNKRTQTQANVKTSERKHKRTQIQMNEKSSERKNKRTQTQPNANTNERKNKRTQKQANAKAKPKPKPNNWPPSFPVAWWLLLVPFQRWTTSAAFQFHPSIHLWHPFPNEIRLFYFERSQAEKGESKVVNTSISRRLWISGKPFFLPVVFCWWLALQCHSNSRRSLSVVCWSLWLPGRPCPRSLINHLQPCAMTANVFLARPTLFLLSNFQF